MRVCQCRVLEILFGTMSLGKEWAYQLCLERVIALCDGEEDVIAKMASVVGVLHNGMENFYWTGFYRVVDRHLLIGPYQGTVGCLRIEVGRGVCGTAASMGETQVVEDVHDFPGHIACDARSRSEIVVPVRDACGELIAVLDVDSAKKGTFDAVDQRFLEAMITEIFS